VFNGTFSVIIIITFYFHGKKQEKLLWHFGDKKVGCEYVSLEQ